MAYILWGRSFCPQRPHLGTSFLDFSTSSVLMTLRDSDKNANVFLIHRFCAVFSYTHIFCAKQQECRKCHFLSNMQDCWGLWDGLQGCCTKAGGHFYKVWVQQWGHWAPGSHLHDHLIIKDVRYARYVVGHAVIAFVSSPCCHCSAAWNMMAWVPHPRTMSDKLWFVLLYFSALGDARKNLQRYVSRQCWLWPTLSAKM